jgi:hypothetical protein
MRIYTNDKYTYFVADKQKKVVAVSTYAGKIVRGVAKCDPRDEFSIEDGKKLAAARCAVKIAKKRNANANAQKKRAYNELVEKQHRLQKMNDYVADAQAALNEANNELATIEASMK